MQLLLDHISSVMIASAVILIVMTTQFQAQRSAIEQTVAYASKKVTLELASVLEQELTLIGDGTDNTIESVTTNDAGETASFVFWRENEADEDTRYEYRLTELEVISISGTDVQLYRLDRFEDDVLAGGGGSRIRHFKITMLDDNGAVTANIESARLLRIVVVNAFPFGDGSDAYLFESHWGMTVNPMNLDTD